MKSIRTWVRFNERVLRFKYPATSEEVTGSIFMKKVFVDCFLFDAVVAVLLFMFLRPSSVEGFAFYFSLLLLTFAMGIAMEAFSVFMAKSKARAKKD